MTFRKWLAICGLSALTLPVGAQQTYSLQQLFDLAEQNNKSIRVSRTAQTVADESLESAKSQRLPDINGQLGISYNGRGLITDRDFSNATNVYIPEFGNTFTLKVNEVIYSGGAITAGIKLGEMGQQMADLDLKKNQQEVRFVITGNYLDIYKAHNTLKVLDENIKLAEQVLENMRTRYDQGTALKNDITRYELQLQNLQLQKTKVQDACKILNYQLCTKVGLPADTQILPEEGTLNTTLQDQTEAYWQSLAATGNFGLQQAALAKQMSEQQVTIAKAAQMPHISVFAEDDLNGPITIEIPAINKNFNYWYVGVGVQYSLSSLFKNNHDVKKARQKVAQANEQLALAQEGVSLGVQAATVNCETAQSEVNTQEKSVQLATENYQVVNDRYENGLALITDMLDASNMKLSAELQLVNAKINQIYCYYQLKYVAHAL